MGVAKHRFKVDPFGSRGCDNAPIDCASDFNGAFSLKPMVAFEIEKLRRFHLVSLEIDFKDGVPSEDRRSRSLASLVNSLKASFA